MIPVVAILFSLAGWSAGTAAWPGKKLPVPFAFDLCGIPILWGLLLFLLPELNSGHLLATLASFLSGFLAGTLSALLFRRRYPAARREPAAPGAMKPARAAWWAWKRFARRMGGFQGRVILGFFYYSFFAPFGLLLRLTGDPLRFGSCVTGWVPKPQTCRSTKECLRQY